jgi:hypothetical protein
MKIELSPISQANTLKCDNVNLTYEQNCIYLNMFLIILNVQKDSLSHHMNPR